MRRTLAGLVTAGLIFAGACNGDDSTNTDGGTGALMDTGMQASLRDTGVPPDAGHRDVESGPRDAGFIDPDTILEGRADIQGLLTWVHMMGSVTSTMPAAVFLHSGPALSHEYLLPHMKRLLPGRLLVFYDMRASGRTSFGTGSSSSTITAAQHAADVDDLLDWVDHHKDTTKVDLIGHGYGAAIAALYAAAHPERVSRLLLTTPYPANIDMLVESQIQFNRRLSSGDRRMLSAIMNRSECLRDISLCFLQLWAILGPKAMCSEHQDKFGDLNFLYGEFRAERFVTNQLQESRYDWEPTLRTIQTPTWIFQATRTSTDCDTVPPESTDIYADSIPGARRFVLHRSGHFPMVEAPDEYFALLKSALIYP